MKAGGCYEVYANWRRCKPLQNNQTIASETGEKIISPSIREPEASSGSAMGVDLKIETEGMFF
ncbi:hypothetical protein A2W54_03425 [Candidatus Giovannonibacteria bacterium RIFCSPHIGHO2_02_43_13]|uniref:Uncharacterized protein n=1 Tax=Candidatus Giovannonibacteria bacterium RIFCSPHIGHO2_02_43_13 TaxID=1798330 RepID=A0A1F5WQG4_9BACT|nr:MAG: hypothetical protein A3E06_00635 [Candidatus Giovannonibacteria bacterium RIFCSPHIGHO2_12_FULL_44_42]OGF77827.1 MAG: hypothetical protein A2W54_03425 [Candidatus Giovannonibacteria bacterium RIFCSPHIGHO2_02_43_13]OGF88838.1 MAG: hypothetical protein A3I94_02430 [Candidatus Giovannonibacteria bacterium RIFCSPLOWO2_02_FULL_43_54]OGF96802.1 MAG: hypothetical protein A3H08_01320 [Candidatus Giovannonibacteria bacterium RIFCSPLOWO2_12_FULL_44_32]